MMIRISDYIQAIRERCPSFKGRVAGASAWAIDSLVKVEAPDLPAAYVVLENEQGGEYSLNGEYLQNVDVSLAVIVQVANTNNEELRGQGDLEQIDKIRGELFRAILFWSPDPKQLEKLAYDGAEVIYLDPERMAYRFDFKTRYRLDYSDTYQKSLYESYPAFKENDLELKQDGLSEKIKVLLDQK